MPSFPYYHRSIGGCGGSNGGFGDSDKGLSELVVAVPLAAAKVHGVGGGNKWDGGGWFRRKRKYFLHKL
jgi:hypothetical protein